MFLNGQKEYGYMHERQTSNWKTTNLATKAVFGKMVMLLLEKEMGILFCMLMDVLELAFIGIYYDLFLPCFTTRNKFFSFFNGREGGDIYFNYRVLTPNSNHVGKHPKHLFSRERNSILLKKAYGRKKIEKRIGI